MKKFVNLTVFMMLIMAMAFTFSGCGGAEATASTQGGRTTSTSFLSPDAPGEVTYSSDTVTIDASNTSHGYVMVKYSGDAEKIKIQITGPDSNVYTYTSRKGDYATFPLTAGNGSYKMEILENISGDMYSILYTQNIQADQDNEFDSFLYPNQYVWFTPESETVAKGIELSKKSSDDLSYVANVYKYVIENIKYDNEKAENVPTDYIPDTDSTLSSGKGICFDYASLMSALLRSQNVPAKLEVGYSGTSYHAWISVYTEETGWVDNVIEFNGENWSLMDPTLASNNDKDSVKTYVGDGSNYTVKYHY